MSRRKHQIDAYFQQGQRLHAAGRLSEAEQVYRQILSIAPNHAENLHMLGVLALQKGDLQASLTCIDEALRVKPNTALFHANRAQAMLALGRPDDALAAAREGLRFKRNSAEALQALGHAHSDLGQPKEAVAAYTEALRQNPSVPDLHNNLGLALREDNRLEEAADMLRQAVARAPNDTIAAGNLAGVLKDLRKVGEAEAIYRGIIRRNPDDAAAHFNLGILLLTDGHFPEGWVEWEWRFRADPGMTRPFTGPTWKGEPLDGRTLLVQCEQGIGDMLQFCRYLPLVPLGGRVIVEVHRPLVPLLHQLPGVSQVIALGDAVPPHDLCCAMMSLPLMLGRVEVTQIPAKVPYLKADPVTAEPWRTRLRDVPGLRVGVVWAGNPSRMRMDRRRSIPLEVLSPLFDVPGVCFVSLQKGAAANELEVSPWREDVRNWTAELNDFADTAALVDALDLVIGVDTAVVHLAGALGKPVWLLNRADTCWRWLLDRDDSPWYPTLTQFRQHAAGAWDDVVSRVRTALIEIAKKQAATEVTA